MKSYRQVIEEIVGKQCLDKENVHSNLPSRAEEQLRKVNFRLHQEKEEVIGEMLALRESYLKLQKRAESNHANNQANEKKKNAAEAKVAALNDRLERTQAVKAKMEKRLYSTKSLSGATQRSHKSSTDKQSTNQSHGGFTMLAGRQCNTLQQGHQSVQTQHRTHHDMSVEANLIDSNQLKELTQCKRRMKQLEQIVQLQAKVIADLQQTTAATARSQRTDRLVGRIVKSKKSPWE